MSVSSYLTFIKQQLRRAGIWPLEYNDTLSPAQNRRRAFLHNIYMDLMAANFYIIIIFTIHSLFFLTGDVKILVTRIAYLFSFSNLASVHVFFVRNRLRLMFLINKLNKFVLDEENIKRNPKIEHITRLFLKLLIITVVILELVLLLSGDHKLLLQNLFSFDTSTSPTYEITMFSQACFSYYGIHLIVTILGTYVKIIDTIFQEIRILTTNLDCMQKKVVDELIPNEVGNQMVVRHLPSPQKKSVGVLEHLNKGLQSIGQWLTVQINAERLFISKTTYITVDCLSEAEEEALQERLEKDDWFRKNYQERMWRKLKKCIEHHQAILGVLPELEALFSNCLLVFFSSCLLKLAGMIFIAFLDSGADANFRLFMSITGATVLFQLFVCCGFGNKLAQRMEGVRDALYGCHWYHCDTRFKQAVIVAMARCDQPAYLKAGRFVNVSLPTLVQILNRVWSATMVMRSLTLPKDI